MRDRKKERGREKRVKHTNTNHMQPVCTRLSTWVLQTFLTGSGSFCVHGCMYIYIYGCCLQMCARLCVQLPRFCLHCTHTGFGPQKESESPFRFKKCKNRAEEKHTHTNTLTRDWVTSGHIHQTTEKHCGVSVTDHLLDRDMCVPPTVGTYGWGGVDLSGPHPHPLLSDSRERTWERQTGSEVVEVSLSLAFILDFKPPLCYFCHSHTH